MVYSGTIRKKSVIKFQQDRQLKKIDGIVGPETWGAICTSINSPIPTTTFETGPKISYVSFEGQTETEPEQPAINLPKPSTSFSTESKFELDFNSN